MDSPGTPTTTSPSSAAEQARIRRERRQAKLKAEGGSRLNKITSTQSNSRLYETAAAQAENGLCYFHLSTYSFIYYTITAPRVYIIDLLGLGPLRMAPGQLTLRSIPDNSKLSKCESLRHLLTGLFDRFGS